MSRMIYISHQYVQLPKEAVFVIVEAIHPDMINTLCAAHSPIKRADISGVWIKGNKIYSPISGSCSADYADYYRVEVTYM